MSKRVADAAPNKVLAREHAADADASSSKEHRRRQRSARRQVRKDVLRVALVVLFFLTIAVILQNPAVRATLFDIEHLRETLHPDRSLVDRLFAYLVFLVAGGLLCGVGFPRLWLSAVAGALFGALIGTPVALAATLAGAALTHFLGRSMLRSMVRARFSERFEKWDQRLQRHPFKWVLNARLFPLSNMVVTSLLFGACKVPMAPYLAASALGFLPFTIVFALFGSSAAKGDISQLLWGLLLFLTAVLIQRSYTRLTARSGGEPDKSL